MTTQQPVEIYAVVSYPVLACELEDSLEDSSFITIHKNFYDKQSAKKYVENYIQEEFKDYYKLYEEAESTYYLSHDKCALNKLEENYFSGLGSILNGTVISIKTATIE